MSWYGTTNQESSFGGSRHGIGLGCSDTYRKIAGDKGNNAVSDPFPPSQRQLYTAPSQEPEPEPEPEPEQRPGENELDSVLLTQELQRHRRRLQRIRESDNSSSSSSSWPLLSQCPVVGNRATATAADNALVQKKRKLWEMDDWTGAKARRPLDIHFAQFDQEAPVWGWGEVESSYRSRPLASQNLPPSGTPSVKRHSLAPHHSQRQAAQTSPYLFDKHHSLVGNSSSSSSKSYAASPSGASVCHQPVVSGTLSEEEQQRFESEGLAILSPSVPGISVATTPTPTRELSLDRLSEAVPRPPKEDIDGVKVPAEDERMAALPKEVPRRDGGCDEESRGIKDGAIQLLDGQQAGLFGANRVNIRAIPAWNDSDDPIEDSEESEREAVRRAVAKKQPARRKPGQAATSRRGSLG